jgi:hypothetical protein
LNSEVLADCERITRSCLLLLWNMYDGTIFQGGCIGGRSKDEGDAGLLLSSDLLLWLFPVSCNYIRLIKIALLS